MTETLKLEEALKKLKEEKKRKFDQTVDLIINLKGIDLKRDQVNIVVNVPNKVKDKKVCGFLTEKSKLVDTIIEGQFAKYSEKNKLKKLAANYLITDLQGLLKGASVSGKDFLITPENFAEFATLIYEGKISSKVAKQVLAEMFRSGGDPSQIIAEKGLEQITDESEIEKVVKNIIASNQKAVEDFKKGKETAFQFLVGQVIKESRGKANPQIVANLLKKSIS